MVSRALNNSNPFSEEILSLDDSKMNFILRMYAEDHPNEYKIIDPAIGAGQTKQQVYASWSNFLAGDAKKEFDRNPIAYLKKHYNWSVEG